MPTAPTLTIRLRNVWIFNALAWWRIPALTRLGFRVLRVQYRGKGGDWITANWVDE